MQTDSRTVFFSPNFALKLGASSQFLAVVEQRQDSDLAVLGPDIAAVELGPACLPEQYSRRYMVDSLGFYRVRNYVHLTSEGKGQFAKEMVELGAWRGKRGTRGTMGTRGGPSSR